MKNLNWDDKKFLHKIYIAHVTHHTRPFKSSNGAKHKQASSAGHEVYS